MNAPANSVMQPQTNSSRMIIVLGLVAFISGLLIVTAYESTRETIATYKQQQLEQAVRQVIPGAESIRAYGVVGNQVHPAETGDKLRFYAGYDKAGKLVGFAGEAAAPGYADMIRLLYGYNAECQCITGIAVLENHDTPGFGDKIDRDPQFLANFKTLDVRLTEDGTAVANPITTVKHGTKTQPWQIDAISGATISSKGVGKALRGSTDQLLPALMQNLDQLRTQR